MWRARPAQRRQHVEFGGVETKTLKRLLHLCLIGQIKASHPADYSHGGHIKVRPLPFPLLGDKIHMIHLSCFAERHLDVKIKYCYFDVEIILEKTPCCPATSF